MSNKIIESTLDSSNIYRIREASFDPDVFNNDREGETYIPGLFDFSDIMSYSSQGGESGDIETSSDIWDIRDEAKEPPKPLTTKSECFMPGFINERPSYLLKYKNSEFYPFGASLQYAISGSYMSNEGLDSPILEDDKIGSIGAYKRDVNISFMGANPGSNVNLNILYYDNEKSSWVDNWSSNAEACDGNLFFSYDIIKITGSSTFTKTLSLGGESPKTYCFSLFARLDDENPDSVDTRIGERATKDISVSIGNDETSFTINTFWKRYYKVFTLDTSAEINLKIVVNNLENNLEDLPLKIAGLMLEEGPCPTPYDKRWVKYIKDEVNEGESDINYYPISIKSDKLKSNTSWTIIYRRYIEAPSDAQAAFLDKIGDVTYGYINGKVVVNGEEAQLEDEINIEDFFNHYETVILTYNPGDGLNIKVVTSLGKTYEITGIPLTRIDNTERITEGELIREITYNLLLGSTTLSNGRYGYYKDLMIEGSLLRDAEIDSILDFRFDLYVLGYYKSDRDYFRTPSNPEEISWGDLFNLSEAAKWASYKLTTDAPDDLGYKMNDILVCIKEFGPGTGNPKPDETNFTFYWSRTPIDTIKEDIENQVVFRSGSIREGYIGE